MVTAGAFIHSCSRPDPKTDMGVVFPCLDDSCDKVFARQAVVVYHVQQDHHPQFAGKQIKSFSAYLDVAASKVTFRQTRDIYQVGRQPVTAPRRPKSSKKAAAVDSLGPGAVKKRPHRVACTHTCSCCRHNCKHWSCCSSYNTHQARCHCPTGPWWGFIRTS